MHTAIYRRQALFTFFLLTGLAVASWVTRTPAIRDQLQVSIAEMGLILFSISVGAMTGILSSGKLVRHWGTRPVIRTGMLLLLLGLGVMAAGLSWTLTLLVALGLMLFGLGIGVGEIALNIEGAEVERITHQPTLAMLHAGFSLGTFLGGIMGIGLTSIAFPVTWHVALTALAGVPVVLWGLRAIPAGVGAESVPQSGLRPKTSQPLKPWRDVQLMCISLIVLGMALAEGSATDWIPILMVDEHQFSAATGSMIYTGFAGMMALGRFSGHYFLERYSRVSVVRASALLGVIGIGTVIFADHPYIAAAAVLFWGLGTSLGFPLAISAAGDTGNSNHATARVSIVATAGYVAFLAGPPLLGFLGEHYSLRHALLVVLFLVGLGFFLARAVSTRA
ncbi:MFS transporter [Methylobacillus flagellatus]|uniref:Major facilitator superfamily MFS_1 n=1 Tax=Methylobacillus flagellatus (strain ATCC 51484 / DSM 6875 / VKM B-1610 / KT) TaxID=265072 RepID=Q1GXX0_METFK|nr:MFS transporter [Methylobacillus flagellatus]ABE50917.1 major facilitator superfamily MFS_1 [Methylobacillus flagellatus KT]